MNIDLPPGLEQTQRHKNDTLNLIDNVGSNTMELAWALGEIQRNEYYKTWGYRSMNDWLKSERPKVSRSYMYALAKVGRYFSPQATRVKERLLSGNITIRSLIDLSSRVDQGLAVKDAILIAVDPDFVDPKTAEKKDRTTDPQAPEKFVVFIPRGDMGNFKVGLTLNAIRTGCSTMNESVLALALDAFADPILPQAFEKFEDMIHAGTFVCRLCSTIPTQPTMHHVLPRSVADGWGPLELLCWKCHEIVQPKWEEFAKRWGYNVEELRNEYREGIRTGTIRHVDPTEGYPERADGRSEESAPEASQSGAADQSERDS